MTNHIKTIIGEDTLATCYFDFQPYEPQTLEYPGCEAEATVTSVMVGNGDFIDDFNKSVQKKIDKKLLARQIANNIENDYIDKIRAKRK